MPGQLQFLSGQFTTPPLVEADLSGKTIIVTGANSGLGLDAAKILLSLNCSTIVLACRSIEKGEAAKKEILQTAPNGKKTNLMVFELELTSFDSVIAFAEKCKALPRIDSVILNAGISMTEFSRAEGYETTITVNVISTFLLVTLLVPILRNNATKYNITPIIAVTGSAVHFWCNPKDLTDAPKGEIFTTLSNPKQAKMGERYFLSKLPVMLLVRYLGAQLKKAAEQNSDKPLVIINNVAPGFCVTNLLRHNKSKAFVVINKVVGRSSEHGARTLVHGATAGRETNGQYLSECQIKNASPFVRTIEGDQTALRLWEELSVIYEKVKPGCTSEI